MQTEQELTNLLPFQPQTALNAKSLDKLLMFSRGMSLASNYFGHLLKLANLQFSLVKYYKFTE